MNGAVFKTVSETVRAGLGRFDSYTPPPNTRRAKGRKQEAETTWQARLVGVRRLVGALARGGLAPQSWPDTSEALTTLRRVMVAPAATGQSADKSAHSKEDCRRQSPSVC